MADLEIGKVSIRVKPNIKGFKQKVEREMSQLRDVELDVSPDMDGFRQKVDSYTKGLKADVRVDLDSKGLRARARAAAQAASGAVISFEAKVNPHGLRLHDLKKSMGVDRALLGPIARVRAGIGALMGSLTWESQSRIRKFNENLIGTKLALRDMVPAAIKAGKSIGNIFSKKTNDSIDKGTKKIHHSSRKIFGLTRVGWIVSAVSAFIGPVISLVSGALAALPALGLAAVSALGVTVLGWEGIKDAAQAAVPAVKRAQDAVSAEFRDKMTPQFEKLGQTLDTIRPRLVGVATGLTDFSAGMVTAVSGTAGLRNLDEILGNTGKMFSDLNPFARDFTSGLLTMAASGSRSFDTLSQKLNNFGSNFRQAAEEMSADGTMENALENTYQVLGSFGHNVGRIIRSGMENFTDELADATDGLFTSFATGIDGLLPLFNRLSTALFPVLGSAFEGLGALGTGLDQELADMSASLEEHAPNLETNGARIKKALEDAFPTTNADGTEKSFLERYLGGPLWTDTDSQNLDKLVAGAATLSEDLGPAFARANEDFKNMGREWTEALDFDSGELVERIKTPFKMLGEGWGEVFSPLWENLRTEFSGEKFKAEFADAGDQISEALGLDKLKESLKTKVAETAEALVTEGAKLRSKFQEFKESLSTELSTMDTKTGSLGGAGAEGGGFSLPTIDVTGFVANITTAFDTAKVTVATKVAEIGLSLSQGLTNAGSSATAAASGIGASVSGAFSSMSAGVQGTVSGMVASVSGFFSGMAANISSSISSAASSVISGGQQMAAGFVSAVSGMVGSAMGVLGGLVGQIQGMFAGAGGWLVSSGVALVQGFISGIRSMIGAVASAAQSVVAAARAFFPNSPAKKGPFSGKGYTDRSGMALVKDFAKGMLSQTRTVSDAAGAVAGAAHKNLSDIAIDPAAGFEAYHRKQVLDPVLESNAKKIHDWRKRQEEAEKKSVERIDEINKGKQKQVKKEESIAKERERLAKSDAESYENLLESLDKPDYSKIDRSIQGYWIDGLKEQMQDGLLKAVADTDLSGSIRKVSLGAVDTLRKTFGDHPVYAQVEANVNAEHFNSTISRVIEESGIAYIPVEFAFSNLDQLKSDLGMGDGVVSRAIDQALTFDPSKTDARYAEENKTEIHYHVTDMEEAIRLEQQRERKEMMKYA